MNDKIKTANSMFFCVAMVAAMVLFLFGSTLALAAVSAEEAAQLKTTLTPFGAERAGNKDGTIPAWTGGNTTVPAGFNPEDFKKRPDLYPNEKPLFTITAENMGQYADKLSDGQKALLKKYPGYSMNVYTTHRTAAAPEWVYENTFKNATRGKMNGDIPEGVYGGIPFPIAKSGKEAVWNHILQWNGGGFSAPGTFNIVTADGKASMLSKQDHIYVLNSYYIKGGSPETWDGYYKRVVLVMAGPPVRTGEGVLAWGHKDPANDVGWSYFPGQRRVRQIPSACCDTPNPSFSGVATLDEENNWNGRTTRYD